MTTTDSSHPLAVEDDDSYNPFADFDAHMGASVTTLYPTYAELRAECPVHPAGELFARVSEDLANLAAIVPGKAVFSHRGVDEILRERDAYSVKLPHSSKLLGYTLLDMDEPEHLRVRRLIASAFTPHAMDALREESVIPIVQRHIDAFTERGHADLLSEFTFTFPVHVIAGMLGLPEEDLPLFHRRASEIVTVVNPERSQRATDCLANYFGGIITQRRSDPRDDLITRLIQARIDGEELIDSEIVDFCRLLLPAGAETTYRSSSILLFALLNHPKQLAAIDADRSLIPQAVEEGLRWETPITMVPRTALHDVTVDDIDIETGTTLALCLAATNRDPAQHERPDEFDIFREQRAHLAFGFGNHFCLGAHLARMETAVALNAVLDRLPGLRWDPDAEPVEVKGFIFRAPPRLPVVWDVK